MFLPSVDPQPVPPWPGGERPFLEIVPGWQNFPARLRQGVVSIGNFDGVHRGHQEILGQLVQQARQRNVPSVVFTFSPHPLAILRPHAAPQPLTSFEYRARLLARFGIDVMVICQTVPELLELQYNDFFDAVIRKTLCPTAMMEGPNFHFGKDRQGTPERLRELCELHGIGLQIIEPKTLDGDMISSSNIRRLLLQGQIAEANQALGHQYELWGTVVRGDGRGRKLGIPTANLGQVKTLIPADGVYAGWARSLFGIHPAAINIGAPVTFGQIDRRVEVHLPGFQGDLYHSHLSVKLVQRIRDSKSFASADELKSQMTTDIATIIAILKQPANS